MPLDFAPHQMPFRFGVEEGQDPHQVPPGVLTTAENVVWRKGGRLEKRYGTTALTQSIAGGGSISAASRLVTRGGELCLIDGTYLYSYSSTRAAWRQVGKVPNVGISSSTFLDTLGGVYYTDSAVSSGGYLVHAWIPGDPASGTGNLWVQVLDQNAGGAVSMAPTEIVTGGTSLFVRVLVIGTIAIVLTTSGANVVAYTIDLTTFAVSAGTNIRTDFSGGSGFDACVIGSNFVIAYCTVTPTFVLYSFNTSLVQQASGSIAETVNAQSIGIDGASGENVWIAYKILSPSARSKFGAVNASTLAQTVAPTVIEIPAGGTVNFVSVCRYDASSALVVYSCLDSTFVIRTTSVLVTSGGVTTNSTRGTFGVDLLSRPFMFGGKCYFLASTRNYNNSAKTTTPPPGLETLLFEAETSSIGSFSNYVPQRYVAKVEHLLGVYFPGSYFPCAVNLQSSTKALILMPFLATAGSSYVAIRNGLRQVTMTLGTDLPGDMWRTVSYGQEAYVSGGVLSAYDGQSVFDYGFCRPAIYNDATVSGAGGSMAAGTYIYAVNLEYRSAVGVRHRSPTGTNLSVTTTGATSSVALSVAGHGVTGKQSMAQQFGSLSPLPTLAVIHRSTVGGAVYFRLTVEPRYNLMYGSSQSSPATLTDTRSDAAIDGASLALSTRPTLYTSGGILDDEQPPAFTTMALFKQRLWGIDATGRQMWFSKSFLDDYGTAPGFSASFRVQFDQTITALATLDEKLVAFWSSGIYVLYGGDQGPSATGQNSDIQGPFVVMSDVGSTSPRGVVSTPDGVMFASSRGIYLLDRKLGVSWIGRAVKDTLASYPNITSAVLVASSNEVRFTANNAGSTAGVVLVWNYVEHQWSVLKYTAGGTYGAPIADACVWNGIYTLVTTSGLVLTENSASFLDSGTTWVPMTLETAWISAAGPIGFQSVRSVQLLGISNTDHDLAVSVGFDGESSYAQSVTFVGTTPAVAVGPLEQCEVTIGTRRKCQSIRFKIQDATPSLGTVGSGQGVSLQGFGVEVGVKRGFAVNPATKKG